MGKRRKPAPIPAPDDSSNSRLRVAAVGLPVLVVAAVLLRLALVSADQLACPSDLVYESPNLATIQQIQAGRPIYDSSVYDDMPFVLTMYTPLYHYMVSWLPTSSERPYLTGRIVSMACMLAAAGLLFVAARPGRAWLLPLVAVGAFFCIRPIVSNTTYLRHDPLGLLLSASAVLVVARNDRTLRGVALAGGLAAAAFLTKQPFLTSGAACLLFLLLQDRRLAALFAACWLGPIVAVAAALTAFGNDGWWFSWFVAPRNPLDWGVFFGNWKLMLRQPVFLLLLLVAGGTLCRATVRAGRRAWLDSPMPWYLAIVGLALLPISAKVGASANIFFEFVLAALLWTMHAFREVSLASLAQPRALLLMLGVCFGQACELALAERAEYSFVDNRPLPFAGSAELVSIQQLKEERVALAREELSAGGGRTDRLLNLTSESWITSSLAGEIYLNDPLAYAVLWEQGSLSPDSLLTALARQDFDVVLLPRSDAGPHAAYWIHNTPAWLRVVQAVEEHYRTERQGVYRYMVRR